MASFIDFCVEHNITQPPDKIVKNLCTFLCQDVEQTPTFAYSCKLTDGILSFTITNPSNTTKTTSRDPTGEKDRQDVEKQQEAKKARLARRGAREAFQQLSTKFGARLLEVVPNMWQSMAGGLLSACQTSMCPHIYLKTSSDIRLATPKNSDILIEKQHGQDVIDSLSVLEDVIPTFHEQLWPKLHELFPMIELLLQSRFAIIRQAAARCFATICDLMTPEAMRYVIEKIVPLLQDPLVLTNRQGATELIYR